MQGLWPGTISEVYPPTHKLNRSKANYEYQVLITLDNYAQTPVFCQKLDTYGSLHNFTDSIQAAGDRVLVQFIRDETTYGVIIGGIRACSTKPVKSEEGYFYRHRYNEIETFMSKLGTWQVKSDDGPNMSVSKKTIILDDSVGEKITLDKENKLIKIEAETWQVEIKGNATINVMKDLNVTVQQNANITVVKDANIKAVNINVEASGQADIKTAGDTKVKAKQVEITAKNISLNGKSGQILTTATQPLVDFITGVASVGVPTVQAG